MVALTDPVAAEGNKGALVSNQRARGFADLSPVHGKRPIGNQQGEMR